MVEQEKHMVVWVEAAVLDDTALLKDKKFQKIKDKLVTFKWANGQTPDSIRIQWERFSEIAFSVFLQRWPWWLNR